MCAILWTSDGVDIFGRVVFVLPFSSFFFLIYQSWALFSLFADSLRSSMNIPEKNQSHVP